MMKAGLAMKDGAGCANGAVGAIEARVDERGGRPTLAFGGIKGTIVLGWERAAGTGTGTVFG